MTDELLGGASPQGDAGNSVPAATPQAQPQEKERLIPQSQVDKLVGAVKSETYQKTRAEVLEELKRNQPQQQAQPVQSQGGLGGMSPGITPDEVRRIVAEQTEQMRWQGAMQNVENAFFAKIQAHKAQVPDFEEKLKAFGIQNMPELKILINSLDNGASVLEDLLKNPLQAGQIVQYARTPGMDHLAVQAIINWSQSIKTNESGRNAPRANPPLDQLTPSNTGTSDGPMSANELRGLDYLQA